MNKQTHNKLSKQYENYKEVLDLPCVVSHFFQDDFRAMEYCRNIDFVALIIPFGKNVTGQNYDCVYLKNDLITYTKMYSELYGSGTIGDLLFLDSAIELSKRYFKKEDLSFEEIYPIAFIENYFTLERQNRVQNHKHRGLVFVARLTDNQNFDDIELSIRNINEDFFFSNPHNKTIFSLAREHIIEFMLDEDLCEERKIAAKILKVDAKTKKKEYMIANKMDTDDKILQNQICSDITAKLPKKFIDIACGNDDIIYEIAKKNIKVYANDIALPYIIDYHQKNDDYKRITFTNLNAIDAKFKKTAFDVLLCKNLLHHINESIRLDLISHLLYISKEVLIVEILHMDEQNGCGKKLHEEFYNKILGETENKLYMHQSEIIDLCRQCNADITLERTIETNNGKYSYVWIKKKD